ncbi:MAG: choice-of-anchor D domain-containing protein, partial [Bacteroidetes bacterium]|nr:choice-of-anchor D domain-containing protein [Bacteroidota bacterium]
MKTNLYPSFSTKSNSFFSFFCCFFLGLSLVFTQPIFAQITIIEDFEYGGTSGNLTDKDGGTGFASAWANGTNAYTSTGLSFGGLSSPGGAMIVASGQNASRRITTGFSATGPISGSFLFKLNAASISSSVLMLGLGTTGSSNNQNHYLGFMPANDGQSGLAALGIKGTGIQGMTNGNALSTSTTYLYAFSYDNGSTSAWILTLAQYNNFFDGTTLNQTAMNAATIGSASTNVTGKVTIATTASNLTTLDNLYSYFFSSGSVTIDRIRLSGTAALGGLGSTAVTYTFNGTTDTNWATASNWSGGVVPTTATLNSGEAVVIASNCTMSGGSISFPSGTSFTINASTTFTMTSTPTITIQSGATLNIDGTFKADNGTLNNAGTMTTVSTGNFSNPSGSFTNSGTFNHSGTSTSSYGGFTNTGTINNSGALIVEQYINVQNNGTFVNNSGGSVQFNGFINAANKTVTNNGTMSAGLDNSGTFTNNNTFSFNYLYVINKSGGTITNSPGATMALGRLPFSNAGTFNNEGTFSMTQGSGLASISNTASGLITNSGTFTVGSAVTATNLGTITTQASATFTNNGTLTGTGTFNSNGTYNGTGTFSSTLFTNPSGGTVAPGTSPGCLTYSNGYTNSGTLTIELGGTTACTQYDKLNVTGTATLSGTLNVSLINSYTGSNGHQLTIINATSLSGTFTTVNLPTNWYINYNLPSAGQVTLSYNSPLVAGAALHFDGTDDFINVPDANALDLGTTLTLEAWVKPASFGAYNIIIDKRASNDVIANYGLSLVAGKPMFYFWNNSSDSHFHTATNAISLNTWTHIAATYDGARVKLYVNGTQVYSQAETFTPPTTTQSLNIGRNPATAQYFSGEIDEVRIWNLTRTCDQINQQFNCELAGSESGLVAYYKFNQGVAAGSNGSVSSLTDATANANHGSFTNFALTGSTSNFTAAGGVTSGTGCTAVIAPEIDVQGGTPLVSITDGATTPIRTNGSDLGNALVNGALTRTFTILNTGNTTLTINTITSTNAKFTVTNAPTSVAANSSATFDVTFNPTALGVQSATITVTNNDCDEATYDFVVNGNGANPAAALHFDGSNDLITASGLLPSSPSQFTVEFWLKPESLSDYNQEISIGSASNGQWNGFTFHSTATGSVYVGTDISSRMTPNEIPANTVVINTWQHFAYVYNNGTGKFYKNGVLIATKAHGPAPSFDVLRIASGCCLPVHGALDELRIWNIARTCEQINQQRNCELTGTEANLVAYYPFNQGFTESNNGDVTTLTDLATGIGGANNGTLTGFTLTGTTSNWIATGGVTTGTNCTAVVAPEIDVQGGSPLVSILDGSTTPSSNNSTSFGNVAVNGSFARTFTIQNTGTDALTVTNITSSNAKFEVTNAPTSVAANGSATFTVTFNPTVSGVQNSTITITNNDCDESTYDFAISGNGVSPAAALNFDGTDDFVSFPTTGMTATEGTISFWMNAAATQSVSNPVLVELGGETVAIFLWNNGSNLFFRASGTGNQFSVPFTSLDTWVHVAMTWEGTGKALKGYVNGTLVGSLMMTGDANFGTTGYLGRSSIYSNGSTNFKGSLDDIRLWNRALCAEEITMLKNCEIAPTTANLQLYFKCNQGFAGVDNTTITALTDDATLIGGANNGTLSNFGLTSSTSNFIETGGVTIGSNCSPVLIPEINVQGKTQDVGDGSTSSSTTNDTDFGNAAGGAITKTFTIQNTGNANLTVSSITSSNSKFIVGSLSSASPISANSSSTFTVTFIPTSTTSQSSVITIANDDCNESVYDFVVTASSSTIGANALNFDGANDQINANLPTPLFGTNNTTLEFWAKGAPGFAFPINFNNAELSVTWGPILKMNVYGNNIFDTGYPIEDCWHHYAFTYNGATNTLYAFIDGQPTPTPSYTGYWPEVSTNLILGARSGEYFWNGTMDELRIWNVQRTQAELKNTMHTELVGNEAGLVAYYNFNQGTAGGTNTSITTLIDNQTSSPSKNGTLNENFSLTGTTSNWVASGAMQYYPEIDVAGNAISITDGDTSPSDDDHTNFGDVLIGNTLTRTYTIKNTGFKQLTISKIESSNPLFVVGATSTTSPLAINSTTTFTVTFSPAALGAQTATITITNDDCNEAPYDFVVRGTSDCAVTASVSAANTAVCSGQNAVFNLTGSSGAIVTYSINNGTNTTITLTGGTGTVTVPSISSTQTIRLVSVDDGSCNLPLTATASVTIKALPTVTAPSSVCVEGTASLTPTTGGSWVSNAPTKAKVNNAGQILALASGSATFTFTDATSGCSNTTSAVSIIALPTAAVSGGGTVCAGETLPNVTFQLTGTAPWNLTYSNGSTQTLVTNITSSPFILTGAAAGTYTVTSLTDANCSGNSFTGNATVTVKPLPVLTAGTIAHPTTCAGADGSIAFTTQNVPDGKYTLTYTGAGSPQIVTVATNAFILSNLGAGTYSNFSITNAGCTQTDVSSKTLANPNPPTLTLGTIPPICPGALSFTIPYTASTLSPTTYSISGTGIVAVTNQNLSPGVITVQLASGASGASIDFILTVKNASQCLSLPINGSVAIRTLPTATVQGTTTACLNTTSPTVVFTGETTSAPYTFTYQINNGVPQQITTTNGNTAGVSAPTNQAGVLTYSLVKVSDAYGCSQNQSGTALVSILTKPSISLTVLQSTVNEGNTSTFCDTDNNPTNNTLQWTVSTNCIAGSPVWRVQVGNNAWSDWSPNPPVTQSSNNQPHRYQAACDGNCPVTYTSPIEVTINSRASVPQNVSLAVDGVTVAVGETKEVCSLVNTTILFAANCATDEIMLYSVDGGDYSAEVPVGLVDNQYHNYRVRCRKSNGLPSCIESESGVMRLKLVLIPSAPIVSLSSTGSCNSTASFSGQ